MKIQRVLWLVGCMVWLLLGPLASARAATSMQSWNQGMALYNAYEFQKASALIRKAIQSPPARWKAIDKAYALVILSVCQLNLARVKLSKRMYEDALALARGVMLPPNLPENIKARYQAIKADWQKRHPLHKKNTLLKKRKKRKRRKKRKTRAKKARKTQPKQRLARKAPTPKATPRRGFQHVGSVVTFGLAGAALASAIGLGVASNSFSETIRQTSRSAPDSATTIDNAYQGAFQTGVAATVLWIAVPVLGGVGVGLLIYESRRKARYAASSRSSLHHYATHPTPAHATRLFATP